MTTPNDALDFYPTPDNLAWKMIHSLREGKYNTLPVPILEPSAGDGALARAVHSAANIYHDGKTGELDRSSTERAKNFELDCIELSSDFRAKLKKDGFRVVHDNFLTFRPTTKYAAIVMNPPFSAGAAHLLKALDVMRDGGKIRCLLNAETIRNPYTNERKALAAELGRLNDDILYSVKYCAEAGLIALCPGSHPEQYRVNIRELTPAGHSFLENIRADTNWAKVKSVAKKAGSFSADVIVEIAKSVAVEAAKHFLSST